MKGGCYVIDIFRVCGGSLHVKLMSTQYADLSTEGLSLSDANLSLPKEIMVSNIREDKSPAPGWSADFSIKDSNALQGADVHVKYMDFTANASACTMDVWVQSSISDPVESWIPRIATACRGDEGLGSTFAGVIEPYSGASKIASVKRLPLADGAGNPLPDSFAALVVEFVNGASELVILGDPEIQVEGKIISQENWNVRTDRELCVFSKSKDGTLSVKAEGRAL